MQVLLVCLIALLGPVAADVLEFHNGPRRDGCALASFALLNFALKSDLFRWPSFLPLLSLRLAYRCRQE